MRPRTPHTITPTVTPSREIFSGSRRRAKPALHWATHWAALALSAVLLALLMIVVPARPARAASSGVNFLRRDYDLHIQRNGDVAVDEKWQVQFTGGPFTSATVGVFLTHADGVDFRPVVGADANSEHVSRVDDSHGHAIMQIAWTFPDAQDTTRTFTISYTLHGAIGQNATQAWLDHHFFDGPGRGSFPVGATKVTVTLPAAPSSTAQVKTSYPNGQLQQSQPDNATVLVEGQNLNSGNLLEVEVVFPRGLLDASAKRPAWQQSDSPPSPPTELTVAPASSSLNSASDDPLTALLGNIGLVLALGLVVLAILGFVVWSLARRLAANIRALRELDAGPVGAPMGEATPAEGTTPTGRPLPSIDLNFGEVDWPSRHETPDLEALGLHPLEESPAANDAESDAPAATSDDSASDGDVSEGDPGEAQRGPGAISGVGGSDS